MLAICLAGSLSGCTSCIRGIPVSRVPPELLGVSKEDMQDISLSRLRQNPPKVYQLGPNDVLGVYIENVLGTAEEPPPVHFTEKGDRPPALGFPIPVREDGTVALPLIAPLPVEGLTLEQATALIRRVYTIDHQILPAGKERIIVTLMQKRTYKVLVVREEAGGGGAAGVGGVPGNTKRGTGFAVDLAAYENDVLHALNATGGLPGLDAENEVIVQRGMFGDAVSRDNFLADINAAQMGQPFAFPPPDDPNVTRIPLRFYPEQRPNFKEDDIILQTGDIVMIKARDRERFYTGGVLRGRELFLPRDYDLDILGAVAMAGGTVGSGGTGLAQANGGVFGNSTGTGSAGIAPSRAIVLRKVGRNGQIPIRVNLNKALKDTNQRILIQPEDVIIVQYTFAEELYNTALTLIRFNFLFNGFSGRSF
jgi:protein involved in polysaccharide export with SLBB domain